MHHEYHYTLKASVMVNGLLLCCILGYEYCEHYFDEYVRWLL